MNTNKYIQKTKPKIYNIGDIKEIKNAYAGDFLSFVIGRAKQNSIWFTIMNNINVAGVAVLVDCAIIVICENIQPDKDLIEKCKSNDITLVGTDKTIYESCVEYSRL